MHVKIILTAEIKKLDLVENVYIDSSCVNVLCKQNSCAF